MLLNVLFVAEGFKPQILKRIDPAAGPVTVKLVAAPAMPADSHRLVQGRVLDPDGQPVVGATVSPGFIWFPNGGGTSRMNGLDEMSITNARGEFRLLSEKPLHKVDLQIESRGLATKNQPKCEVGGQPLEIRMTAGATVRGRIVKNGQPCPNLAIGLVQEDRNIGKFVGPYSIGTDKDGYFTFNNVAPEFEYFVYAKMESLRGRNEAVPAQKLKVGADGSTANAGALEVKPGHRLRGRVVLSDGKPIPADTRLLLSREEAWDSQIVPLEEDGRFEVQGVPAEAVSIGLRLKGYALSKKNATLDLLNGCLIGRVEKDIDNLTLLLEPGEFKFSEEFGGRDPQPKNKPLWGVDSDPPRAP